MLELCDDMEVPSGHGRQSALARLFEVTPKAARKWLTGAGYPEMEMVVRISIWANVNVNWLLQGVGPKRGTRVDSKALVLDEALRSLPPPLANDLVDSLRAKLVRIGKIRPHTAEEPQSRYEVMLNAYEHEIEQKHPH